MSPLNVCTPVVELWMQKGVRMQTHARVCLAMRASAALRSAGHAEPLCPCSQKSRHKLFRSQLHPTTDLRRPRLAKRRERAERGKERRDRIITPPAAFHYRTRVLFARFFVVSLRSSGVVWSQGSETTAPEQTHDIAVTRPGTYRHDLPQPFESQTIK